MIHVQIGNLRISGDSQEDLDAGLGHLGEHITDKQMADIAKVTFKTIRNWRADPHFPRPPGGRLTRAQFLAFLYRALPPHS